MTRAAPTFRYHRHGTYEIVRRRGKTMQSHLRKARCLLTCHHVLGLFVIAVVCALLFMARTAGAEPTNVSGTASGVSVARDDNAVGDDSGPTVILSYGKGSLGKSTISSFMYFVPLISPTLVDRQTSAANQQEVVVASYNRKIDARSFYVACDFEIRGKGVHQNTFDPAGMIAARTSDLEYNKTLRHALDYIRCEGEGFGRIEIKGTIDGLTETVTEVDLQFNARGRESPVTIGIYDIEPKDGEYKYENRTNKLVARVNTLTFKRDDRLPKLPRMEVKVASITTRPAVSSGFFAHLRGAIANLLIKPSKITELGNETMLNFGYALLKKESEFTFPKAENIKKDSTVSDSPLAP